MKELDNTVIKVLNEEHGKKVIEWWKSQGVDTMSYSGSINLVDNGEKGCIYYGLIDGRFENYSEGYVEMYNVKIIELPQEKYYSIKGTPLPVIPEGTEYRCVGWSSHELGNHSSEERKNHISFGLQEFKGEMYVMHEIKDYDGRNYYMTPLSIIQELDKKEQSKSEPMKTRIIKPEQGQQIIDIACSGWKEKLFDKWGKQIVLKQEIAVEEDFYQEMRKACTTPQNELFDKIFGKEEEFIPKGTPCLVRGSDYYCWKLVYSNGDGTFEATDSKKSHNKWTYVQVLDVNNLPTE